MNAFSMNSLVDIWYDEYTRSQYIIQVTLLISISILWNISAVAMPLLIGTLLILHNDYTIKMYKFELKNKMGLAM